MSRQTVSRGTGSTPDTEDVSRAIRAVNVDFGVAVGIELYYHKHELCVTVRTIDYDPMRSTTNHARAVGRRKQGDKRPIETTVFALVMEIYMQLDRLSHRLDS